MCGGCKIEMHFFLLEILSPAEVISCGSIKYLQHGKNAFSPKKKDLPLLFVFISVEMQMSFRNNYYCHTGFRCIYCNNIIWLICVGKKQGLNSIVNNNNILERQSFLTFLHIFIIVKSEI